MSYTEIVGFDKSGNAYAQADIKNAFRGAVAIWEIMGKKYCGHGASMWNINEMKEIWNLSDDKKVPIEERIVMFSTLDNCLVKKENFERLINAFRTFGGETSLKEQADVLEEMLAGEDCIAVGWNQTSVSKNKWLSFGGYDEEKEEYIPYNCISGTEHYWLFDELEKEEENAD